ncbi:hypothetical protein [Nakamurella aerolata]|uniref:Uncharacterized protein n=1 Tax=Nakamurella aerolata TaxID=1656892 RepID=A0A849A6R0_9ACTN|nr:hypothetical protein [Nakamurella aerolata]NNG36654.1 hypothetical protein [Nakamurella aerolata]
MTRHQSFGLPLLFPVPDGSVDRDLARLDADLAAVAARRPPGNPDGSAPRLRVPRRVGHWLARLRRTFARIGDSATFRTLAQGR